MDHLVEAKGWAHQSKDRKHVEKAMFCVHLATAHAMIALAERVDKAVHILAELAERLPPPAETWSASAARLRREEKDG